MLNIEHLTFNIYCSPCIRVIPAEMGIMIIKNRKKYIGLLSFLIFFLMAMSFVANAQAEDLPAAVPDARFTEIEAYPTTYFLDEAESQIKSRKFDYAFHGIKSILQNDPLYWRAWYLLAVAYEETGKAYSAASTYLKAVSLLDRCANNDIAKCGDFPSQDADFGQILFEAGYAHLKIAQYDTAASLLGRAVEFAEGKLKDIAIEWHAIALTGSRDLDAAWTRYRKVFRGEPFPVFNDRKQSAKKISRARKPPFGFYAMVRQGFLDLRNNAYQNNRFYAEYAHAQNVSRVEALQAMAIRSRPLPLPFESYDSREYLVDMFLRLSRKVATADFPEKYNLRNKPGFLINPALSRYAFETAEKAEKAVDRGKYVKAEDLYRLALASDPWWLEGNYNLAKLEFINYGWCGPDETLDYIKTLMSRGVDLISTTIRPNRFYMSVNQMQAMLDDIYREAGASDSFDLQDWCNIEGSVSIRPDRAVGQ